MRGLADLLSRRRRLVVGFWALVVAISLPFAARQTENLTAGGFDVPESQSQVVAKALEEDFPPDARGAAAGAILVAEPGSSQRQRADAVGRLVADVESVSKLSLEPGAAAAARRELAAEGVAVVPLVSGAAQDEVTDAAVDLREEVAPGELDDGVTTYLTGQHAGWAGLQELSKEDLEKAEIAGFPLIALILLAVFGSLAAASLPLALGFGSVVATGALIWLISQQMEMSVFVTNMASMIGIGVAVDYSLFILARFREEVRAGKPAAAARREALATSGVTVVFSGTAVIVSLAGLWMISNQALRSMALGAMVVVAISMLTAVLLLPALIRVLGHRVEAGGRVYSLLAALRRVARNHRPWRRGSTGPDAEGFWEVWTRRVMRRPIVSAAIASSIMLLLATPVLWMKTGTGALEQFPAGHDVRTGVALLQQRTGAGSDPVLVHARFEGEAASGVAPTAALERFAVTAGRVEGVERVEPPVIEGEQALIAVYPSFASDSDRAQDLVAEIRSELVPGSRLAATASVAVGGEPARTLDVRDQISDSMWKIIAFILGLSFIVLTVMLRSVVLPLKAILMNLLSIGAAYGVLVVVFQWGWLDGVLGFDSLGAIDALNPPLILAVVFGLSMDYEVFLLSRIRERYRAHGDTERAVAEGLSSSARTITSAALIMTTVFAVFAFTGVPSIKELGVGNAVAIALDATLVRLVLVPSFMQLMGEWNWWMPSWLDRALPEIDLEGAAPQEAPPAGARA